MKKEAVSQAGGSMKANCPICGIEMAKAAFIDEVQYFCSKDARVIDDKRCGVFSINLPMSYDGECFREILECIRIGNEVKDGN